MLATSSNRQRDLGPQAHSRFLWAKSRARSEDRYRYEIHDDRGYNRVLGNWIGESRDVERLLVPYENVSYNYICRPEIKV